MISSTASRIGAAFVLSCLLALQASPASAAKDRFYRTKPHVNVSASTTLPGGGTAAQVDPNNPWKKRVR